jgi:hypothetical protein
MGKSKNTFKDDFSRHPVVFSLVFGILFITAIIILLINLGPVGHIWPTEKIINTKTKELTEAQKALQEQLNILDILMQDETSFRKHKSEFWIDKRDGDPKVNLQKRINKAASDHGFTLSSVGAARADKIIDGIYFMTTNIRGEGPLKNLVNFIGELQGAKPRFYWQSILIRPKSSTKPGNVMLTGAIQIISVSDPEVTKMLLE